MKSSKLFLIFSLSLLILISVLAPSKVFATDITVGATTWYTWWDMAGTKDEADPTFLYGPALAVKFNDDFNLTFIFLYGKFDFELHDSSSPTKTKLSRTDSDLALNYRLNDFFKVFVGGKYNAYSMPGMDFVGYGPALGLSATMPVTGDLFLLGTFSGFYLWATDDEDHGGKSKAKQSGYNSSLSIAYYIAPASTTISLGGRYQYMKVDESNDHSSKFKFYGFTLTATYTFEI